MIPVKDRLILDILKRLGVVMNNQCALAGMLVALAAKGDEDTYDVLLRTSIRINERVITDYDKNIQKEEMFNADATGTAN